MKMLLLPKAPLDLHVAANLSENWRILNNFSQADFKFSHDTVLPRWISAILANDVY